MLKKSPSKNAPSNKPVGRSKQQTRTLPIKSMENVGAFRNFVFYGRSGSGKTTLAASFPKPILLIDIKDRGTDSISDIKGIDVLEATSVEMVEDAYWYLTENPDKYKTVIIDTVTQLQSIVVDEIKETKRKAQLHMKDWSEISGIVKTTLNDFRDLTDSGMQVVFLAQDRTTNVSDDDTNDSSLTPEVGPALSPAIAGSMNAGAHVIGHTFVRERVIVKEVNGKKTKKRKIEYCLGLGASSVYIRKVRKPKSVEVPEAIVDASYEDILDIIEGE